jgi:hypothetical protein
MAAAGISNQAMTADRFTIESEPSMDSQPKGLSPQALLGSRRSDHESSC